MKPKLFLFLILINGFGLIATAQNKPADNKTVNYQKEIDEQVWDPFIAHFQSYNSEAFMSLHDPSMKRVLIDNNRIRTFEEYARQHTRADSMSKAAGHSRTIEFKFTKRVANADFAFEEGYYKSANTKANGERSVFYGKFWVTLKKVNGVWKVTLDADSSKGITEEVYNTGQ